MTQQYKLIAILAVSLLGYGAYWSTHSTAKSPATPERKEAAKPQDPLAARRKHWENDFHIYKCEEGFQVRDNDGIISNVYSTIEAAQEGRLDLIDSLLEHERNPVKTVIPRYDACGPMIE